MALQDEVRQIAREEIEKAWGGTEPVRINGFMSGLPQDPPVQYADVWYPFEELEKLGVEPKDMSRILARAVRLEAHGITDEDVTHAVWGHYQAQVGQERFEKLERLRKLAEFWGREGNEQEGLARFSRNFNGKPLMTQGQAANRLKDILGEEH